MSQPGVDGLSIPFSGRPPLDWMNNGSFMLFRRLNQLVPEFDKFVLESGAAAGIDPVLLGARLLGRWKSGAAPSPRTSARQVLARISRPY